MIDTIVSWINGILGTLLSFLPTSPFRPYLQAAEEWEWIGWLNWVVPVKDFIIIGTAWLACVSAYYLYSLILRWIRAVQ